ncbi:hypothetical protein BZA77DRAFT_317121 [Pyronema omphalodes]|nr:hypothetical protein BZA77DRAFT_317121 [Pyronema omphalodes]
MFSSQYPQSPHAQFPQSPSSPVPSPQQPGHHYPQQIYLSSSPQPPYSNPQQPPPHDLQRNASVATTVFRTNGVQYRPPKRNYSEDLASPITRHIAPSSPQVLSPSTESSTSLTSPSSSWGFLFTNPRTPNSPAEATPKLQRLLRSIAEYLAAMNPVGEGIITQQKLEFYYNNFSPHPELDHRGSYMRAATKKGLARLWAWLGCTYYWVGEPNAAFPKDWEPALTVGGFQRWSIIQLLLCPDLECAVIDAVLRRTPLRDPESPMVGWPRGLEREAVGGVDQVAGELWGRWWSVLLEKDEEEDEIEILRNRIKELLRKEAKEVVVKKKVIFQEEEEPSSPCDDCARPWCGGCPAEQKK